MTEKGSIVQFLKRYKLEILNVCGEDSKKDLKFLIRHGEFLYISGGLGGWIRNMACLKINAATVSAGIPLISTQNNAVRGSGNGWLH